jgi:hypothetical protein
VCERPSADFVCATLSGLGPLLDFGPIAAAERKVQHQLDVPVAETGQSPRSSFASCSSLRPAQTNICTVQVQSAKELQNPIASLTSIPFKDNFDLGLAHAEHSAGDPNFAERGLKRYFSRHCASDHANFPIGAKYYAARPNTAPDWGLRATLMFLFPAK